MLKYYLIALLSVFVTSIAQILLKKGANYGKEKGSFIALYLNTFSISGYFLFVMVTLLNLYFLKVIPLKELAFIVPVVYILVPVLSYFFLGERLSKRQQYAILIIFAGILIFNLDKLEGVF